MLVTICVALRFYPILDIMGGFINAIGLGLGWYALSREMDIQFVCYCGMLCAINVLFDAVKVIALFVDGKGDLLFKSPLQYLTLGSMIASPILMIGIVVLTYCMYKDYQGHWYIGDTESGYGASTEESSCLLDADASFDAFTGSGLYGPPLRLWPKTS